MFQMSYLWPGHIELGCQPLGETWEGSPWKLVVVVQEGLDNVENPFGGSGRGSAHWIWRLGGEELVLERLGNTENPFGESR
jgi:hypothetical protein